MTLEEIKLRTQFEKQEPVEGIIIPLQKRDEILDKLRKVLQKWNTLKYLNYST